MLVDGVKQRQGSAWVVGKDAVDSPVVWSGASSSQSHGQSRGQAPGSCDRSQRSTSISATSTFQIASRRHVVGGANAGS